MSAGVRPRSSEGEVLSSISTSRFAERLVQEAADHGTAIDLSEVEFVSRAAASSLARWSEELGVELAGVRGDVAKMLEIVRRTGEQSDGR